MPYLTFSMLLTSSHYKRQYDKEGNVIPTYITISPQKDGITAKTKCVNPARSSSFIPLKRKLKKSSSNFTAILPKLRVRGGPHRRRSSSLYLSDDSSTYIPSHITESTFCKLPTEILSEIIYHLDYHTIHKLARTCNFMYSLCQDDQLWKKLVYADFNFVPPKSQSKELVLRCNQKMVKEQKEAALGLKLYRNHLTLGRRWVTGKVATTRFLHGHEDSVYCLAWVGNDRLVSGSRDKTIKLWDVNTGECIKTIKDEHNGSILCIRVDHENKMLLTGSSDATCSIWSLPDLQCITRLRGHGHSVLDVCVVGNLVVTSSRDHTLRVWDKSTGTELRQLTGHLASVNALEPINSSRVASASGDSTIKIWDIETGECLRTLTGHQLGLACVRFDGTYLYSGGLEGKIKVWDTESGECVNTLQGHSGMIRSIDCLEGKILSGSYDRTVKVWDAKTGNCILSFQSGHSSWIFNVLLSGTRIVSSGQEKRIMILDFASDLSPLCNPILK